jgi:hypothetical protein
MQATTPIDVDRLETELKGHPDQNFVHELIHGLRWGFDTGIECPPTSPYECKNLSSARAEPEVVESLLVKEVSKGYLLGPFDEPPFSTFRISPIGIATGKYSGKKRLIVDLSAPHENSEHPSLNELIDKDNYSLSYVTIDDAIEMIKSLGQGAWLCKTDITDAFKLIPIAPHLWHLYGVKWEGKYYFYQRLVFGSRSSPKIFDNLSVALCWIAEHNYHIENILHLLDDFLTLVKIPTAPHKTIGPAQELEFLGIILDTLNMQAKLPAEKVLRIVGLITSVLQRHTITKRELLVLLGHFNFASRVIVPGRSFVSFLIKLSTTVSKLHHRVTLNAESKKDLRAYF